MELRAEGQESAILATILLSKDNGSSTDVTCKLALQGIIEAVKSAVYHFGSSSKRILQVEYIRIRSWRQDAITYHYD